LEYEVVVKLASDNDLISIEKQAEPCQNNYMMTMRDECPATRIRKTHERVWECGCGCFSKCFLFKKMSIIFFYFLKIIFKMSISK
jgi:hypothetical protein